MGTKVKRPTLASVRAACRARGIQFHEEHGWVEHTMRAPSERKVIGAEYVAPACHSFDGEHLLYQTFDRRPSLRADNVADALNAVQSLRRCSFDCPHCANDFIEAIGRSRLDVEPEWDRNRLDQLVSLLARVDALPAHTESERVDALLAHVVGAGDYSTHALGLVADALRDDGSESSNACAEALAAWCASAPYPYDDSSDDE